jgi:hypothetical protein
MSFLHNFRLNGTRFGGFVLVSGMALTSAGAQTAVTTVPDAQVEANVLRQLANAPELSTQDIQSNAVYGVVTLSGVVQNEDLRTKAENLTARAQGVKKVVDELTLGDPSVATANQQGDQNQQVQGDPNAQPNAGPDQGAPGPGMVLQSDGTYAPATGQDGNIAPTPDQGAPQQANSEQPGQPGGNDQGQPGYPNGAPYGQQGPPPPPRQPMANGYGPGPDGVPPDGPYAGQRAGLQVTVPVGAPIRIRINRGLDSQNVQVGTPFDGTVMNDVVSNGAVAIPRGATVQGTVVDVKKAGVLKGRGELSLQLTGLTLGGQVYPLQSAVWDANGRDKTASTVNRAVGLGAIGALFGAVAGGGAGAAIGAGIGAGAGVASSAASPNGRVVVPPETVLPFTLAQAATVMTVSQQEMARLSYSAGPGSRPTMRRYYNPNYGYYYGPAY